MPLCNTQRTSVEKLIGERIRTGTRFQNGPVHNIVGNVLCRERPTDADEKGLCFGLRTRWEYLGIYVCESHGLVRLHLRWNFGRSTGVKIGSENLMFADGEVGVG